MHLVGLGPDMARGHVVHRGVEGLGALDPDIAEKLPHSAIEPAGEGGRTRKLVLVDPALAFVHAHGDAAPQNAQRVIGRDVLLVARMPDLVDRGIEAAQRIGLVHARGDPNIRPGPG